MLIMLWFMIKKMNTNQSQNRSCYIDMQLMSDTYMILHLFLTNGTTLLSNGEEHESNTCASMLPSAISLLHCFYPVLKWLKVISF